MTKNSVSSRHFADASLQGWGAVVMYSNCQIDRLRKLKTWKLWRNHLQDPVNIFGIVWGLLWRYCKWFWLDSSNPKGSDFKLLEARTKRRHPTAPWLIIHQSQLAQNASRGELRESIASVPHAEEIDLLSYMLHLFHIWQRLTMCCRKVWLDGRTSMIWNGWPGKNVLWLLQDLSIQARQRASTSRKLFFKDHSPKVAQHLCGAKPFSSPSYDSYVEKSCRKPPVQTLRIDRSSPFPTTSKNKVKRCRPSKAMTLLKDTHWLLIYIYIYHLAILKVKKGWPFPWA